MDWKNLVITFLVALAVNECTGITKWLARQIIRLSLHCLPRSTPEDEREILENGWLSHHEETQVHIVALFDSVGVFGKSVSMCVSSHVSSGTKAIRADSRQMLIKLLALFQHTKLTSYLVIFLGLSASITHIYESNIWSKEPTFVELTTAFLSLFGSIFVLLPFIKKFKEKNKTSSDEILIDVDDLDL